MESNLPPENNLPPPAPGVPPIYHRPPPILSSPEISRRTGRGRGWKVLAIFLLVLLAISGLLNFKQLARMTVKGRSKNFHGETGPQLDETTVRENDSTNKIVVVPIEGVITGEPLEQGFNLVTLVKKELKMAKEDKNVKAVILKVDSPGGEVLVSDEIAKAIRDFQNETQKPVIVSMGSLAASGGYYISAPCQWIVANELTITGSIGVIMHGYNYRALLDKIGVRPEVFKSGKYKDMLSGTKSPEETSPEERQMVQALIDETFGKFKSVVADGRKEAFRKTHGQTLASDWESYADGRILSGNEAFKLGFVDEIGDFDDALARAKKLVHISDAEVVEYKQSFDLANLFHIFGQSGAKSVKLDMGVDLPRLRAGCQYFIMPTYLQ